MHRFSKFIKHLILYCTVWQFGQTAMAQAPFHKTIALEEENTSVRINVLFKDRNGLLWAGSSEGLYKITGNKTVKVKGHGTEKCQVTAIGQEMGGTMWIGCKNGKIFSLNNKTAEPFKPEEGLPKEAITSISADAMGRVWFGTGGEGIYVYDKKYFNNIDAGDGLSDNFVNCLYPYGSEMIAGTDRGLSFIRLEGKQKNIQVFTSKNGLPDNIVRSLSASLLKGNIWVGTQSKGICHLNIPQRSLLNSSLPAWEYGQVNDIKEQLNEIVIATQENGVMLLNKRTQVFSKDVFSDSLAHNISDIETDDEENTWFANEDKLLKSTGAYLRYLQTMPNTELRKIHTLLADAEGSIFYTPDEGLYQYSLLSKKNKKIFSVNQAGMDITCLYKDPFGFLWAGTMGGGLYRINTSNGQSMAVTENPLLKNSSILCIAGKNEDLWISSLNGVCHMKLGNGGNSYPFTNYSKKDGIGSDYVYHILIDAKNRVWFGTDGAGLTVYENSRFKNFNETKEFSSGVVYSLAEDNNNNIWINTYNDGIFRYDGKQFKNYTLSNGLSDLATSSMTIDNANRVILVNKKGIDILNPADNTVRHHGPESGFNQLQENLNAITKDNEGNIWIGTNLGITRLTTGILYNTTAPKVILDDILLFNQPLPAGSDNIFKYNENNLNFYYTAINYSSPEKINYQYILEGYDLRWNSTNDQNLVFSQLKPGRYTLKIRASTSQNYDTSPVTSYSFTIGRPFWFTWWFILLSMAVAGGIIYYILRQRVMKVRRKEQIEKERFQLQYDVLKTQVNPHFLFNSFNALMNVVEEDPKEAAVMIKHLSQFYRKMTAYRHKDVVLLKEEIDLLQSYFFIQQKRFGTSLQVTVDLPGDTTGKTYIPPFVFQLLAENAVKHNAVSKDKPLHISITQKDDKIFFSNNINPKLEKEESEGMGLQNIEHRYRFFAEHAVTYGEKNGYFVVELPVLKLGKTIE
ncbi:MAG: two-component regulator propeller domain-containing protein [Ferruginibacter sp.]